MDATAGRLSLDRILPQPHFLRELQASRVYSRNANRQHSSDAWSRRPPSFASEAAFIETSSSFGSSLTLLDSKASTHPSSQSTIHVAPLTAPSAAEHSVDAALFSFRSPSAYSLSPRAGRQNYGQDIYSLPRPLGRPLPAAGPALPRPADLHFSAQRARPRSELQSLTSADIHGRFSLLQACHYGDVELVEALLAQGVDPNTRDFSSIGQMYGAAAIHIGVLCGHYDVVRALLRNGARVDEPFRGFTRPLHESVRRGDSAIIGLLLDNGAALDARDERGHQPLHVAQYLSMP